MQTSFVLSQRHMPGAGDVDDCAPTAAMQCQSVTAPWLRIASVPAFRKAAGVPDRPGPTGLSIDDVYRGQIGVQPVYAGLLHKLKGWTWEDFTDCAKDHHPMCVATVSAKLPTRLQFGFKGYHQISVVVKGNGTWLVANPLAPPQSRWQPVTPAEIRPAIMGYGRARSGTSGAWAVAYPTDAEMAATFMAGRLEDLYREAEEREARIDALEARIDNAQAALEGD